MNAKKAHDLQNIIGRPSTQDLIEFPMTRQDILRAEDIFGPNIGLIKGRTTHTKQKHVQVDLKDIPQELIEKHGEVTLAIDVMFINKIPFIMTTSCNIQFEAITRVDNEQSTENTHDNIQPIPEEESDPDNYVTIGAINIMSEMNTSNRGAVTEQMENEETDIRTNER